jgi:hypothetical protein
MNDAHIERLLLSLKPVQPSTELLERVEHDMELHTFFQQAAPSATSSTGKQPSSRRTTWHVPVAWASVGAAAAAALVISLMPPREVGSSTGLVSSSGSKTIPVGNAANATPVSTNRQVLSAEDRGIISPSSGQVMRQILIRSLEKRLVIDPTTGEQAIVEVPVEEIVTVPAQVQ